MPSAIGRVARLTVAAAQLLNLMTGMPSRFTYRCTQSRRHGPFSGGRLLRAEFIMEACMYQSLQGAPCPLTFGKTAVRSQTTEA
jgi:hypothetical protein